MRYTSNPSPFRFFRILIIFFIILALVCFVVSLMIIVFTFGRFVHPFASLSSGVIKILMKDDA